VENCGVLGRIFIPFHSAAQSSTDAWFKKVSDTIEFRVGTASWTDPTVNSELFYARSAEERLRFYAEQFNTAEVDSTFYALPAVGQECGVLRHPSGAHA
jgi:hypothetical protein